MTYRRKYRKGPRFASLAELVEAIERGECVYLGHKITPAGWARGMTLHTLSLYLRFTNRGAFRALPNDTEQTDG